MPRNWSPGGFLVYCTSSFISVFLCPKSFVRFFVITSHLSVSYCQVYSYKHLSILYFCSNLSQREVQHMVNFAYQVFLFFTASVTNMRQPLLLPDVFHLTFLLHVWCMHCHNLILQRLPVQPPRQPGFMLWFEALSRLNCLLE